MHKISETFIERGSVSLHSPMQELLPSFFPSLFLSCSLHTHSLSLLSLYALCCAVAFSVVSCPIVPVLWLRKTESRLRVRLRGRRRCVSCLPLPVSLCVCVLPVSVSIASQQVGVRLWERATSRLSEGSASGSRSNKANYGFEFGDSCDTETWFSSITRCYSWHIGIFQGVPKILRPRIHVQKRVRHRLRTITPA